MDRINESRVPANIESLLSELDTVFRDDLLSGLPPKKDVDHSIEVSMENRPPTQISLSAVSCRAHGVKGIHNQSASKREDEA